MRNHNYTGSGTAINGVVKAKKGERSMYSPDTYIFYYLLEHSSITASCRDSLQQYFAKSYNYSSSP